MGTRRVIQFLLEEYSKCFDDDKNRYKQDEVIGLSEILND
jgi:hypothetical protein